MALLDDFSGIQHAQTIEKIKEFLQRKADPNFYISTSIQSND